MSVPGSWRYEKFAYLFRCLDQSNSQVLDRDDILLVAEAFRTAHGWDESDPRAVRNRDYLLGSANGLALGGYGRGWTRVCGRIRHVLRSDGCLCKRRDAAHLGPPISSSRFWDPWTGTGDGRVSLEEYREYLIAIGSELHAETAFEFLDTDASGYLELSEMQNLMVSYLTSDSPEAIGNRLLTGGWYEQWRLV